MKKGHGSKFDRLMHNAIAAVRKPGATPASAAAEIGISHNTMLKWMKEPEFKAAYREEERAEFSQSKARLRQGSTAAVNTMLKNMLDPKAPHTCRQRAAEAVYDRTEKAIEHDDLVARVEELERALKEARRFTS